MELLLDALAFVAAVVTQWGAMVGGLLAVILDFYLRVTRKTLTQRRYVQVFGVVFLLAAFYLAWREQHDLVRTFRQAPRVAVVHWDPVIRPGQDWRLTVRDRIRPGFEAGVALFGGSKLHVTMENEVGSDRSAEERTVKIDCGGLVPR